MGRHTDNSAPRSRRPGTCTTRLATLVVAVAALMATAPSAGADGIFVAQCDFSHRAMHDPIVLHGMPGASHSHDFFGNVSTGARSTLRSLRSRTSTCRPAADRSAYWVPTLYRDGRPVRPLSVRAYYQDFFRFGRVQPPPAGLRIVAGRADARGPQPGVVRWSCAEDNVGDQPTIPSCGADHVAVRISFPDCWDGRRLDSPDHRSHMAYNRAGGLEPGPQRCPPTHPVLLPALQVNVFYPIHDGRGVKLASGSVRSAHADFFNAWKPSALRREVNGVLNAGRACDPFLGCTQLTGPNTEPVTARPKRKLDRRFFPPR
jgi:hypothetical protein